MRLYQNCIFFYRNWHLLLKLYLLVSSCVEILFLWRNTYEISTMPPFLFMILCISNLYMYFKFIHLASIILGSSSCLDTCIYTYFIPFYRVIYQIQILVHNGGLAYIQVKKKKQWLHSKALQNLFLYMEKY